MFSCKAKNLKFNFQLDELKTPAQDVKYLGAILDVKLGWSRIGRSGDIMVGTDCTTPQYSFDKRFRIFI